MLELWYQALRAKVGIRIRTDNPAALRPKLYAARVECLDPELNELTLRLPHGISNEVWIVHKKISVTDEELDDASPE